MSERLEVMKKLIAELSPEDLIKHTEAEKELAAWYQRHGNIAIISLATLGVAVTEKDEQQHS